MTWFKIGSRVMQIFISGLIFLPVAETMAEDYGTKLDVELFQKIAPMGMTSDPDAYPQWQEVSIGFRDKEPVRFLFPVRTLVERITAKSPSGKTRASAISFDQIEVGLFRSTSYVSLIYNVRVALKGSAGKEWFFIASFRGKRNYGYLRSIEAQQQICGAIVECLNGIERTGGFQP